MGLIAVNRDLRVDFFRGVALWMIFIDHIPGNWISQFSLRNFALCDSTEVFVLLAGYAAGIAYGRSMDRHGWVFAGADVLRRAWVLYIAHIFLFVVFSAQVSYSATALDRSDYLEEIHIDALADAPYRAMLEALLLHFQPAYLDILPMYIALLVVFAFVMPLLRRRWLLIGLSARRVRGGANHRLQSFFVDRWWLVFQPDRVAIPVRARSRPLLPPDSRPAGAEVSIRHCIRPWWFWSLDSFCSGWCGRRRTSIAGCRIWAVAGRSISVDKQSLHPDATPVDLQRWCGWSCDWSQNDARNGCSSRGCVAVRRMWPTLTCGFLRRHIPLFSGTSCNGRTTELDGAGSWSTYRWCSCVGWRRCVGGMVSPQEGAIGCGAMRPLPVEPAPTVGAA